MNENVPGLFKDEVGGKIMTEYVTLRAKAYAYLDDDGNKYKTSKGTKKCVIKQKLIFQNFKDCLLNNKTVYRSQERFESYNQVVYTEEVNKEGINNLDKFYTSREEVINFFRDYTEMLSDANYNSKQNETKGTGLKTLTPEEMIQD